MSNGDPDGAWHLIQELGEERGRSGVPGGECLGGGKMVEKDGEISGNGGKMIGKWWKT